MLVIRNTIGAILDSVAHQETSMRAKEFVIEKKKRKKKLRGAAWGPGPYGGYGYAVGYSGDGGGAAAGGDGGGGGGESIEHENFADGKNPQDKGDSARHGIKKGTSIAQLKKIRSSDSASARKKQLAHWQINMRQGKKK
jgi:hypothetical protein